jgi:hypothetical protein
MITGGVVGTIVTLNPIGGLIGAMIGAGASVGVNEFSKELDVGHQSKDHSLVTLQTIPNLGDVKEDQGQVPVAALAGEKKRGMSLVRDDEDGDLVGASVEGGGGGGGKEISGDAQNEDEVDDSDILLLSMLASRNHKNNLKHRNSAEEGHETATHGIAGVTPLSSQENKSSSSSSSIFSDFAVSDMFNFSNSSTQAMQRPIYSPLIGRYFTTYSSNPLKAQAGSIQRDDNDRKRWAIWTREAFKVIRFAYDDEQEARADFNKWVYVRLLTDEDNNEVEWNDGWHPAPKQPLADIRKAIELNK